MDMNYLVQRRINAQKKYRRKVTLAITLGVIFLVLVMIGLVKVITDEKKAENGVQNTGNRISENLTPGAPTGTSSNREQEQEGTQLPTATPAPTVTEGPTTTPTPMPTPVTRVAIDAGHGGEDLGSTRKGLYEKDANLAIALYLKKELETAGYEVYMIRESDEEIELERRSELAKEQQVDLYVSIHLNSLDGDNDATQGAEVWYADSRNDGSDTLAQYVVDELTKVVDTRNRGVKLSNKLVVLRCSEAPACLVECGFITSETERTKLFSPDYQQKLAEGIANGIKKFLPLE